MQRDAPISEVMTREPQVVAPHHTLSDVRKLLTDTHIHHLPVVDGTRLIGLISSTDLIGLEATLDVNDEESLSALIDNQYQVSEVMQKDVITVGHTATVGDAAGALSAGGFHSVPVVDDAANLVGIVTSTDLIGYLLELLWPTTPRRMPPRSGEERSVEPGESELRMGIEAAGRMRSIDQDPEFLAASLLYFKARSERFERAFKAAERYLHSGLAEQAHGELVLAIEAARHGTPDSLSIGL